MRSLASSALLAMLLFFTACSSGKIYEDHKEIKGNVWNRFDVLEFEFNVEDISPAYDFYVAFRYMEQMPLDHIDIEFTFYSPSGETRSSEHRVEFRDSGDKPLGKGMGDLWDLEKLLREGYKYTEPGICKVEISSTMSYADIPGIMQVGLVVRKSQ